MPAGQFLHEVEPDLLVKEPGPQRRHTEELLAPSREEYIPAPQLPHAFELFAPSNRENVPAGQLVHRDEPGISE